MELSSGTTLGSYEIVGPLGAGGMGEVYRARDSKLRRDVAIKILPEAFLADPDRIARFEREARVLAALNHPHIAAIYGLEAANGFRFLVLELVEGETLADRLVHGRLPLREALTIARETIEALEAAHEKGIVHRDLKPANIALSADGRVKVLDFGLAKQEAANPAVSGSAGGLTQSPTLTFAATQAGVILGTAAYMSPEQAKGKPTDKRTDIWAFGCVLYEMLTGKRAFDGDDVSDMLAAVLRAEPDWTALPADTPYSVRTILARCLEKDRRTRIPDLAVARFLLEELPQAAPAVPGRVRRSAFLVATTVVFAAVAAAIGAWTLKPRPLAPIPAPLRFIVAAVGPFPLGTASPFRDVVMSPDGSRIVYAVSTAPRNGQLMVRAFDTLEPAVLAGLEGVAAPFVSFDGRWVGFFANSPSELKKVLITGGPAISLCRVNGNVMGAAWTASNTIVFASNDPATGLLSIPAAGGEPTVVTTPDRKQGELDHILPAALPQGDAVLFTIVGGRSIEDSRIAVLDLKTGRYKTLIRNAYQAEYVADGYLVYGAAGSIRAIRFDPTRLETIGDSTPVVEQVLTKPFGRVMDFSTTPTGSLVYAPGRFAAAGGTGAPRSLVWVDRKGHEQPIKAPLRAYAYVRLSPDGTKLALDIRDEEQDIWTFDLARETLTRLTVGPGLDVSPVWTPDGHRILYAEAQEGGANLFWQRADGGAPPERLTTSPGNQIPTSVSPDGALAFFHGGGLSTAASLSGGGNRLMSLRLDGKSQPQTVLQTAFNERNGSLSPDGHWLAYDSDQSGHNEVYVRPFPDVNSGLVQVSNGGGERPLWAPNGRELFYLDADGFLTSVPTRTAPQFGADRPTRLLQTKYFAGGLNANTSGRAYDVTADGKRFVMIKESATPPSVAPPVNLVVVLNLAQELESRLGRAK